MELIACEIWAYLVSVLVTIPFALCPSSRNHEVQGEVKKLASQYGQLLGHQNHKQKIQHLVKLKQDNVTMREEMASMRLELDKYRR